MEVKGRVIGGGETLEVRCCCVPKKLLGWMTGVPKGMRFLTVVYKDMIAVDGVVFPMPFDEPPKAIDLPIRTIRVPGRQPYKAIKAEGMTIKELIRIPGFLPNPEAMKRGEHFK